MKTDFFHEALLRAIRNRLPEGEKMAHVLMDTLFLGKEAVYRRLRGEVPFTLSEAGTISKNLGISLDALIGTDTGKSRPFQLNLIDYNYPNEVDYAMLQNYLDVLNMSSDDPYSEITVSANTIPQPFRLMYESVARFFLFKWRYHHEEGPVKSYGETTLNDRLKKIHQDSIKGHKSIKSSCFILDSLITLYLVNDIKYFSSIQLINPDELQEIKQDLLNMFDYLEKLATSAKYENGNDVYLYVSNINFESTYTYLRVHNTRVSFIDVFLINAAASVDEGIYKHVKTWVLSLRRLSTLISHSGELQRIKFFKEQRQIIETL